MKITAVVLAGGRGTRIAELYPGIPKPLIPVCGRPFVHWVTDWLVGQGISDIVYSIGYQADQMAGWVESAREHWKASLHWASEDEPLGTGGGVMQCLPLCGEHVLVVNGDSLAVAALAPLKARAEGIDGALLGVKMNDAARYGTLILDDSNRLVKFLEKRPGAGIINAGVYLLSHAVLSPFPRGQKMSLEEQVLPKLLAEGAHLACEVAENAPFLDIGTPESLAQAEDFVHRNMPAADL